MNLRFPIVLITLLFLTTACPDRVSFSSTPKNVRVAGPEDVRNAISALPANCGSAYPVTVTFSKANNLYTLKSCRELKWRAAKNIYEPSVTIPCTGQLQSPGNVNFTFTSINTSCSGSVNLATNLETPINYTCTGAHNRFEGYTLVSQKSVEISGTACAPIQDLAPVVNNPGNQNNKEGNLVNLQMTAVDPEGKPVSFSASGLPPGLSINSSGLISGTVAVGASAQGTYSAVVRASDGTQVGSTNFSWLISQADMPPNVTNPGAQTSEIDAVINLPIQASSPNGNSLGYTASNLPPGLSINSTGVISGTVASSASTLVPYSTTITVRDLANNLSTTVNFNWTIILPITSARLTWDAVTENATGYKTYISEVSGSYVQPGLDVGNVTMYTFTNLTRGKKYYFVVTAYNSVGGESAFSLEVSKTIP
ncbi:MAG: fibronectin type III domain-containing protein [Pseudomonadota bacterium]|nr:fibronectin type III domain-containing protein [Pseudomonadota bacterium]